VCDNSLAGLLLWTKLLQILAKELAGRLQVLDNNAHPFYKPKLFVVSLRAPCLTAV